ncbi:MAG: phosphoribosyltransferase [Bacteroides sp.]|nr:phosphoribosyltransferase [Bacteroides sp.]
MAAFSFDLRYLNLPSKEITEAKVEEFINEKGTKRINFATSHIYALSKYDKGGGKIFVPFPESIESVIKEKLGSDKRLFESKPPYKEGFYRMFHTDQEYEEFESFVEKYKDIVFLRDHLDLSLALSMNFSDENKRTKIGELEYQAKFQNNKVAEAELIEVCKEWIEELPFYKHADYICAMPGSDPTKDSLPKRVVRELTGHKFTDISDKVSWVSKSAELKNAESPEAKLAALRQSGLTFAEDVNLAGKTVVLLDDLYMSGVTMQYVACKLKEAGAKRVLGLCLVKSRSNTAR